MANRTFTNSFAVPGAPPFMNEGVIRVRKSLLDEDGGSILEVAENHKNAKRSSFLPEALNKSKQAHTLNDSRDESANAERLLQDTTTIGHENQALNTATGAYGYEIEDAARGSIFDHSELQTVTQSEQISQYPDVSQRMKGSDQRRPVNRHEKLASSSVGLSQVLREKGRSVPPRTNQGFHTTVSKSSVRNVSTKTGAHSKKSPIFQHNETILPSIMSRDNHSVLVNNKKISNLLQPLRNSRNFQAKTGQNFHTSA